MNDNNEQQAEVRIERVLGALRSAEPAAGMEQRINAALLRAGDEVFPMPPRWTWLRFPQLAGLATVLLAGVLLSLHTLRHHASGAVQVRAAIPAARSLQHVRVSAVAKAQGTAVETSAAHSRSRAHTARSFAAKGSLSAVQAQQEQGFPAPPLPLTEQERLLVRLVHRDDPVQLSQLTPSAREADVQRDREQVREFFKPPPMLAANFTLEPYPIPGGTQ